MYTINNIIDLKTSLLEVSDVNVFIMIGSIIIFLS